MVRDRRLWVTILCIIINPAMLEARRLESKLRTLYTEKKTANAFVHLDLHRNRLQDTAKTLCQARESLQQYQPVEADNHIHSYSQTMHSIRRILIKVDDSSLIPQFLSTPGILSRPPPADKMTIC
jgi:hypothetical protein